MNQQTSLSDMQLTGLDRSGLIEFAPRQWLLPPVAEAFVRLQRRASEAGFDLQSASAHRDFERQRLIWNAKASGERVLHDDQGVSLNVTQLTSQQLLHAILRYSAVPGSSRHHWGTDLDVFDAAAVPPDYQVQLSPPEVASGGLFAPLHSWLDAQMAVDCSEGFFRPYGIDTGGVAPERWHLSYAPLAQDCAQDCSAALIAAAWSGQDMLLLDSVMGSWELLYERYVKVAPGWCSLP